MKLEELCMDVVELAREVGIFIKMEESKVRTSDIEEKSRNSLVSYVDKTAEEKLVSNLKHFLPESGFIAEEGTSTEIGEKYNWIVDPLDGTTNFLHGIPTYSVSVALKENDEIVLGVVYEVNRDECFYAWKNGKAYLNGEVIRVSNTKYLKDSLLATGFPYYDFDRTDEYFNLLKEMVHTARSVRRIGSAAVDLAYVAAGRFDGFVEYSLNAWDVAAGAIIVQEAGGTVHDFNGGSNWLFGKEMLATNNFIQAEFSSMVRNAMST